LVLAAAILNVYNVQNTSVLIYCRKKFHKVFKQVQVTALEVLWFWLRQFLSLLAPIKASHWRGLKLRAEKKLSLFCHSWLRINPFFWGQIVKVKPEKCRS
jgi:hypothetical protein